MRAHSRMAHGSTFCTKVCCVWMSHISVSPFLLSCFVRRPCCSRTVTSTPRSRPHRLRRALPDRKARVKRTSARAPRSLATWPIPRTSHLLMVPALISTECVPVHSMHSSKSSEICCYHSHGVLPITKATSRPSPTPCVLLTSRITNIEQIVSTFATKMAAFAEMEQNVISLTTRICKIEAGATSASGGSSSASSWNLLGQSDGSTATVPWVPWPRVV